MSHLHSPLRALAISLALLSTGRAAPATAPAPAKPGATTGSAPPTVTSAPAATSSVPEPADIPSPKNNKAGTAVDAGFLKAHESFLKRREQPIGILFLGDSITAGWVKAKEIWDEHYGKHNPANFGISGDKTQHVLWRIANGELDGIKPKVLVLMIGTNNSAQWSAEDIIKGDLKIVEEIHKKLPQTKLLLLGIFPRKPSPNDPLRAKIKTVNEALAKLDDGKRTRYLDLGPKFLDPYGRLSPDIMLDYLHPNDAGYKIWAEAMQPLLDEMLK